MKKTLAIAAGCLVLGALHSRANDICVTNVSLYDLQEGQKHIYVQFDLSWENSWRQTTTESSWDAAWVFVKYRPDGVGAWQPVYVSTNDADHEVPAGVTIKTGLTDTNGLGVFIYRSSDGIGDVNYPEVRLRWNYGSIGIQKDDEIELAVFAVEMVYVPAGSFYVGDGTASTIQGQFEAGISGSPFLITDEAYAITLGGGGAGSLGNNNGTGMTGAGFIGDDFNDATTRTLPAAFPKGYAAFYCMKAELSQGQYADFLTMLTDAQDDARYPNKDGFGRHTISGSFGDYAAGAPNRACNYLDWRHSAAYADWAGLRPITELEYEKACRGPIPPVTGEFAWGTANAHGSAYTLANDGQTNALVTNPGSETGNASWANTDGSINGPLRCGIFAASTVNPTREEAGASYYGLTEMSGNLWDAGIVTAGRAAGRSFTGSHGDGVLSADGYGNNSDWPGYSAGKISGQSQGICARGSYWNYAYGTSYMRVSSRHNLTYQYGDWLPWYGWRGGRTAP